MRACVRMILRSAAMLAVLIVSGLTVGAAYAGGKGGAGSIQSDLFVIVDGPGGVPRCVRVRDMDHAGWLKVDQLRLGVDLEQKNVLIARGHNLIDFSSLESAFGELQLRVTPADARVSLNGNDLPNPEQILTLEVGTYELLVQKTGHQRLVKRVVVHPCGVNVVEVALSKIGAKTSNQDSGPNQDSGSGQASGQSAAKPAQPTALPQARPDAVPASRAPAESAPTSSGQASASDAGEVVLPSTPVVSPDVPTVVVGEVFKDCPTCPEMITVPAGTYIMGEGSSDGGNATPRRVTIERPFAVSILEVTFQQWDACVRDGGCGGHVPNDYGWGRGGRPVVGISWDDASAYVSWVSSRTGSRYRLLSEAEWEYVARGNTQTAYWWGEEMRPGVAHCVNCETLHAGEKTALTGSFAANPFGLFDTVGNVWEWTQDCYAATAYTRFEGYPAAYQPQDNCQRVVRGGGWDLIAEGSKVFVRFNVAQRQRANNIGLRVAKDL